MSELQSRIRVAMVVNHWKSRLQAEGRRWNRTRLIPEAGKDKSPKLQIVDTTDRWDGVKKLWGSVQTIQRRGDSLKGLVITGYGELSGN
ncbi:hypothetical protein DY000_02012468 [Brassica cretica]|uniref:Uncharacterized protein n=1 Tax=Brassica cretica TaxID=69181 RepID=A0ABQ7CKM1_BRACR|nr:hypothetical protein DY000_02012468 [Brassica cretica]